MDTIVTLHEYFNTSNQTSPHFERHESYVEPVVAHPCGLVANLDVEQRCQYILLNDTCKDIFLINYYQLLYCSIGTEEVWKVIALLLIVVIILSYLYSIMTTTSTKFFCPSVSVFSQLLGLSENVAGVTLVAFANGLNNFISGVAGRDKASRLHFTDTYGANLCVMNLVAGTVLILQPFSMNPYFFLRDICFLLLYGLVIDFFFKTNDIITLTECILLLLIYILYIIVVIAEHLIVKEERRRFIKDGLHGTLSTTIYFKQHATVAIKTKKSHESIDTSAARASFDIMHPRNHHLWHQFWEDLSPINREEWKNQGWFGRTFSILQSPPRFLLNLFIPVVDYEERRHGWSKLLNCIQMVILPFGVGFLMFGGGIALNVSLLMYSLFISVPFSIYIFQNTRTHVVPYNHTYLSFLTLMGAIVVSYTCAMEVLSIFDAIGVITGCGNTFIGATFLAWSNSFNDLLTNVILTQQGHVVMGFSGCFGASISNYVISLTIFVIYAVSNTPEKELPFAEGTAGETVNVFLIISLSLLLLGSLSTNFTLRRSLGIFLVIIYAMFVAYAIMGELDWIHAFGTDHRFDMKMGLNDIDANAEVIYDEEALTKIKEEIDSQPPDEGDVDPDLPIPDVDPDTGSY